MGNVDFGALSYHDVALFLMLDPSVDTISI